MIRTLLGAAAAAAIVLAVAPAQAARVGIGCSGQDLAKTEGTVESMADGPAKSMAQREIAGAQDAMLKGSMRGCAVHLSRAAQLGTMSQYPSGTMAQGPYGNTIDQGPYAGAMAQAPAETPRRAAPPAEKPLTPAL
jgi:hypothetical protein